MPEQIPANVETRVFFATSAAAVELADIERPLVAVIPNYNSWNDYGRGYFAKLRTYSVDGTVHELHIRIMFDGFLRSSDAIDELIEQNGPVFAVELIETPFVSLLPEVEDYETVIRDLGFEIGVSSLRKLNDAVVVRIEGENAEALQLMADEEFHVGVLRPNGAYDALRRGGRFFRPQLPEPVQDAAGDFVFGTRLKSADNPYIMKFDFKQAGLFRSRVSVLIGRNGVGKTQLLKSIVDGLHTNHPAEFRRPHFFPAFLPSRVLVFSAVSTDPFPEAIGAWHGIDYEYFALNAPREEPTDSLLAALVACKKADFSGEFGPNSDQSRLDVVRGALERIGLWSRLCLPLRHAGDDEDDLPNVIDIEGEQYFPISHNLNELNSLRLVQRIDWTKAPIVLDEEFRPRELSSGEIAMLRFSAQVSSAIEQGSLLLLDEPETHLHPNFISDFMEILDDLLRATGSVAIIATHSAYVVREAPRTSVSIFSLEDRFISIGPPRLQTFGASIDAISQFIFEDGNYSHNFQRILDAWAREVGVELGIETIIERYGAELNSESLSFIARRIQQLRAEG